MNLRREPGSRRGLSPIDITPLVDVVFILLIFLLVSTTFKSKEQAFSIVLPVGDQESRVTRVERPTVYVSRMGQYVLYEPGEDPAVPVEGTGHLTLPQLSERLKAIVGRSGKETSISVKGDAKTDYQHILDVVNECRRHGLERVYFPYKVGEGKP